MTVGRARIVWVSEGKKDSVWGSQGWTWQRSLQTRRTVGDPDVSILEGSHPGQRSMYVMRGKGPGNVFDLDRGSFGCGTGGCGGRRRSSIVGYVSRGFEELRELWGAVTMIGKLMATNVVQRY